MQTVIRTTQSMFVRQWSIETKWEANSLNSPDVISLSHKFSTLRRGNKRGSEERVFQIQRQAVGSVSWASRSGECSLKAGYYPTTLYTKVSTFCNEWDSSGWQANYRLANDTVSNGTNGNGDGVVMACSSYMLYIATMLKLHGDE